MKCNLRIKISHVRDWRSTPTYGQLQSPVTQKLGRKSGPDKIWVLCTNLRISVYLPAHIISGGIAFENGGISGLVTLTLTLDRVRRHLRSSAIATDCRLYRLSGYQPWATDHSLSPLHGHGTAVSRTGCIVAHHLPTRTENISFSLEFSAPLVANSLFPPMLYAGTLLTA